MPQLFLLTRLEPLPSGFLWLALNHSGFLLSSPWLSLAVSVTGSLSGSHWLTREKSALELHLIGVFLP